MEVGILGPLRVVSDDVVVEVAAPMQRALLSLLAIHVGELVSTDRLLERLWGDEQPAGGVKTLRYHVSKLREALGAGAHEVVVTQPPGYMLSAALCRVDASGFRALVAGGRAELESDPTRARGVLVEALGLWRGRALAEFEYREFARGEARRLEEERLQAIELRVKADLALGRHDEVVPELGSLVEQHPYREGLRGLLITALYRAGRQTDALRAYQETRRLLGEELGIEPSPELAALEEQVLLHDESLEAPVLAARFDVPGTNLPTQLTPFVGRAADVAALEELVGRSRLVTVTGPGGSGKTRLGLEVAQRVAGGFRDGVRLVELAPIGDPALVPQTIADTLGVRVSTDAVEALRGALEAQSVLVVLDNFEHVIESAPLISRLLKAAPNLRVLVTSRQRLRLSGEHVYPVPQMKLADATSLFLQQAQAVRPGFELTDENTRDVVAICGDLDGLPLAIELAAARVDVLPPAALRDRLSSRLTTLTGGTRDHPVRQRTLRDTIDWSYEMLEAEEQRLFGSLAVFTGGLTLEAVEAVCGPDLTLDVLDGLQSLTDKSLIHQRPGPDRGPRFFLLETIHEYARGLLDGKMDTKALRLRHCDYFTDLAERVAPQLGESFTNSTGDSPRIWHIWQGVVDADFDNLRAALAWAFSEGDPLQGCRLLALLGSYWMGRGRLGEVRAWKGEALRHVDALDPAERARLYRILAQSIFLDPGQDPRDTEDARAYVAEALKWSQAAGDHRFANAAILDLAWGYVGDPGNYDHAMSLCRQALDEAQNRDDPHQIATTLTIMGELARFCGDDQVAAQAYEDALQIYLEVGDRLRTQSSNMNLAFLAAHRGDHQAARHLAAEALKDAWEMKHPETIALGLDSVAQAAAAAGEAQRAARILGAADRALAVIGTVRQPSDQPEYNLARATLAQQLQPAELETLLAEGRAMTRTEAVTYALEADTAYHDSDQTHRSHNPAPRPPG